MSLINKIERVKIEDGVQVCWCSREQLYKPCSNFTITKDNHGFTYYCRDCLAEMKLPDYEPEIPIYVRKGADKVLQKIGYKTNSEIPVHQQFLIKHFNDRV